MPDLTSALPLIVMALSCNLCLLSAMTAGRAESGSWTWAVSLFAEIATLSVAGVAAFAAFGTHGPATFSTLIFVIVALGLGFLVSIGLAFLEYAALGRRSRFRADLRGSLWISRTGASRL